MLVDGLFPKANAVYKDMKKEFPDTFVFDISRLSAYWRTFARTIHYIPQIDRRKIYR